MRISPLGGLLAAVTLSGFAASVSHAQDARHVRMHAVKELLARSEHEQVAVVLFGDSRSSWQRWRVPGAVFRQWDVKWAGLIMEGNTALNGHEDGLGQMVYALNGVDMSIVAPGAPAPWSGIMNRYPLTMAEQWVRPGTDENLSIGIFAHVASTSGGMMHQTAQGVPGGRFFRGDPAQQRAVESLEFWAVTNNSAPMLGVVLGLDFNGDVYWPWVVQQDFAAPVGAGASPEVVVRTMPGIGTAGTNIRMLMSHRAAENHQYAGRGHNWLGTRINFAGQQGCVMMSVAQGGWSLSDHLPASVYGPQDNGDWKYGSEELSEVYRKCVRSPRALLRWEVGANLTAFSRFEGTPAEIKENNRVAVERAKNAMLAGGAQEVVVELVSYWGSAGDEGGPDSRSTIWREALRELAVEQGWSFYDQLGALRDGDFLDGNCPKPAYREDTAHQSFAGMNLLGRLEWDAIRLAAPKCGTADFNGDGDFATDADIEAFFACLADDCCDTCFAHGADFNADGDTGTDADIEAFFRVLAGGSC